MLGKARMQAPQPHKHGLLTETICDVSVVRGPGMQLSSLCIHGRAEPLTYVRHYDTRTFLHNLWLQYQLSLTQLQTALVRGSKPFFFFFYGCQTAGRTNTQLRKDLWKRIIKFSSVKGSCSSIARIRKFREQMTEVTIRWAGGVLTLERKKRLFIQQSYCSYA